MANADEPGKAVQVLDTAIGAAGKLARSRVDYLRQSNPHRSDAQLLKKLDAAFTSAVVSSGAATGAVAAAPEHQRVLVLMVLAGGGGSSFFSKAAGRTGPHLGKVVTNAVPLTTLRSINKVLGPNFVTKYGTQRGIITLGKVAPFGVGFVIGAGGNMLMARSVIKTTKAMFDSADALNADEDDRS